MFYQAKQLSKFLNYNEMHTIIYFLKRHTIWFQFFSAYPLDIIVGFEYNLLSHSNIKNTWTDESLTSVLCK